MPLISSIARFIGERSGSIGILFALMLLVVFGTSGAAIDTGRWLSAKSADTIALDAAVMAGARVLQTGGTAAEAKAAAVKFYEANKSQHNGLDSSATFDAPDGQTVVGFVEGKVQTTITGILGIEELAYRGATGARIVAGGKMAGNLEIAVMLDVTGSMCADGDGPCTGGPPGGVSTDPKIRALKDAAKELVEMVVWEDQAEFFSKVAIVPFSTYIRVAQDGEGTDIMATLTNMPATWSGWRRKCTRRTGTGGNRNSEGAGTSGNSQCVEWEDEYLSNWKVRPCVTDRNRSAEYTDAAPGSWAWLNAVGGNRYPHWKDSGEDVVTDKTGKTQDDPVSQSNYNKQGKCPDIQESNEILPLTADKDALLDKIEGLQAYGATNGGFATAFAWYMLSPNWGHIWGGNSAARPYNEVGEGDDDTPGLRKVAILMSDGVYNTWRGWKNRDKSDMRDRAKQMCEAMKATGIEIYTVGFALDELSQSDREIAEDTLRSCGTTIEHFYNTLSADEIKRAFRSIANTTTSLALFTPEWPAAE